MNQDTDKENIKKYTLFYNLLQTSLVTLSNGCIFSFWSVYHFIPQTPAASAATIALQGMQQVATAQGMVRFEVKATRRDITSPPRGKQAKRKQKAHACFQIVYDVLFTLGKCAMQLLCAFVSPCPKPALNLYHI